MNFKDSRPMFAICELMDWEELTNDAD
jgi:hypothetical protein